MKNSMIKSAVFVLVGMILLSTLLVSACSQPSTSTIPAATSSNTTTQTIKLKMGSGMPPSHPLEQLNKKWCEKIQNDTNGRVQITLYSGGTLIDQAGAWDQLLSGVADIANISPENSALPFHLTNSLSTFTYGKINVAEAREIFNKLWNKFPEISAEYTKVKRLFGNGSSSLYLHTKKKPIRTLNDIKGLQLNPSATMPEIVAKLGATGSILPMMEVYNAVDKGIVDGTFFPVDQLKSMNFADVTKYSTDMYLATPPVMFYAMNLNSWNSLPPDIQKVFEDSVSWWETETDKIMMGDEQTAIDWVKAKGHEFFELSSEDQIKLFKAYDEISLEKVKQLDAEGLPANQVFQETRRLVDEYTK
jgi:TRAP-type transport system periplasmic protein